METPPPSSTFFLALSDPFNDTSLVSTFSGLKAAQDVNIDSVRETIIKILEFFVIIIIMFKPKNNEKQKKLFKFADSSKNRKMI